MLVTLLGAGRRPVVTEVEMGTPVRDLLALAGGPTGRLQALLIGGYFGSFVNAQDALDRPYCRAGLTSLGADVGAGVVVAFDDQTCGVVEAARIANYLAGQSAGQCGPCVFGLAAVAKELDALASGHLTGGTARLQRWLAQVEGRGACHLPDGATRVVFSALRIFSDEVTAHVSGRCRPARDGTDIGFDRGSMKRPGAGSRRGLRLRVDPIACDGYGFCAELLPEVVTLDDWGYPIIVDSGLEGDLAKEAKIAVRLCPKLALRLDP